MDEEVAGVPVLVTKTTRKWSPGSSPDGVMMPARACPADRVSARASSPGARTVSRIATYLLRGECSGGSNPPDRRRQREPPAAAPRVGKEPSALTPGSENGDRGENLTV